MLGDSNYSSNDSTSIDTPNSTYFKLSDVPQSKVKKFRRLRQYNENVKTHSADDTDSTEKWKRERLSTVDLISSSLEMPQIQQDEARQVVKRLNFREYNEGQYLSLEIYSFVICSMIHNRHSNSPDEKYLPIERSSNPELFERVREDFDISLTKVQQGFDELFEVFNL